MRDARHRRARVAADQRMRGTGGQSEPPGDQVPGDRADQAPEDHVGRHVLQIDHPAAHGFRHAGAHDENRDEVKRSGPQHGLLRRQDARGHHGGDGIGGIVEAVDEIERQRDQDDDADQDQRWSPCRRAI